MTTAPADPADAHPVLAALGQVDAALKGVRDIQPVFMGPGQKRQALLAVREVRAELAELELRLMAAAGDVAAEDGAADVAAWLAHQTRSDLRTTRAELRLAEAVDARYPALGRGMADGTVSPEQAGVITRVLDALPAVVSPEVRERAEAQLVAWCSEFRPEELRRLGRRILEVVAPQLFEDAEATRLLEEEQTARKRMRLTFKNRGDGLTRISGLLPTSDAERLKTYLHAYTSPRHARGEHGEADRIPYSRRLAAAFGALLEHLDPRGLPLHGGDATTVMVTVTLDDLKRDLGIAGLLGEADDITAAEARRLACTAGIVPAVLGNHSEVLDLGRADRLYRPAQRKAIRLRDQHCRAEGCTHPAPWCEVHHLRPWSKGGPTDLANAATLCPHHHHRIHDPAYEWELRPDRSIRIRKKRE